MSCANCSTTVGDALESLDGVSSAEVNFATDEASVEYDPERVSLADIYATIEEAGYDPVSATTSVGIADMSCAN
jgi:Cu+-exporting ATPase